MTTELPVTTTDIASFTPEEARSISCATNVEMVGLLASMLAGFAAAYELDISASWIMIALLVAIVGSCVIERGLHQHLRLNASDAEWNAAGAPGASS